MIDPQETVIQEILSTSINSIKYNRYSNLSVQDPNIQIPNLHPNILNPMHREKNMMTYLLEPWQIQIENDILRHNDLFVNVSPAGGKSLPVQQVWLSLLKHARTWNDVPRIIWVCETKTLAVEVRNNFRDLLYSSLTTQFSTTNKILLPRFMIPPNLLSISPGNFTRQDSFEILKFVNSLISIHMQGATSIVGSEYSSIITPQTIAISCTYSFPPRILSGGVRFFPRMIVIDEIQERFKPLQPGANKQVLKKQINDETANEKVRSLISTIRNSPPPNKSNIIILTGSMNPTTSQSIVDFFNNKDVFNRNFKLITAGTEGAKNRASLTIVPFDGMCNKAGKFDRRKIIEYVSNQIKNNLKYNLIAIFSKSAISEIAESVCKQTLKRTIEEVVGSRPSISTPHVPNEGYPKMIAHYDPNKLSMNTAVEMARSMETSKQFLANVLQKMIDGEVERITDPNSGKTEELIYDQELGKAILHGVAYIMTKGTTENKYHPNNIRIVELLLKRGQINTVLATTAVGVGVNLKVRNLFIPTLIGPFGGDTGFSKINISSLIQLIHRAGRRDDEVASIYCHPNDTDEVRIIAQSGDPSSYVDVIPFNTDDKNIKGMDLESRLHRGEGLFQIMSNIYKLISR